MREFKIVRIKQNLISINGQLIFKSNNLWYNKGGTRVGVKILKALSIFLQKENSQLELFESEKENHLKFDIEELNEWNFVLKSLFLIDEFGVADFTIVKRTEPEMNKFFKGLIMDELKATYIIKEDNEFIFNQLMIVHHIIIHEDFEKRKLTLVENK